MQKATDANGYTLIELLAVIGILSLVAAVATPIATNVVRSATARSDAYLVMSALRRCQGEAVARQQTIILTATSDILDHSRDFRLSDTTAIEFKEPLTYFPDGTSSGGRLVLHNGTRQATIIVAWLTGALSREQP